MARFLILVIVLAMGVAIGIFLPTALRPERSVFTIGVANETAEVALERPIEEVHLDAVPLQLAIDRLATQSGIPIVTDSQTLEGGQSVTLHRRGERLADLLRELLDQSSPKVGVWIEPDGDRIRLWSEIDQTAPKSIRIYDVRGLLGRHVPASTFMSAQAWTTEDDERSLANILESNISNGRYTGLGHQGLRVDRISEGRLVVDDRWEVHRQIRRILSELYQPSMPLGPPATKTPVYTWNAEASQWVSTSPDELDTLLQKPMPGLRLDDLTLEQAINAFSKASGVLVSIDPRVTARADAEPMTRIRMTCPPATAGETLERVIGYEWKDAYGTLGFGALDFVIHDGGVRVIDASAEAHATYLRYYDLRSWPPYRDEVKRQVHPKPGVINSADTVSPATDALVRHVMRSVDQSRWGYSGDITALEIHGYEGVLLVRQTLRGHLRVRQFLAAIRSFDDHLTTPDSN